eukprot:g4151.t1
MVPPALPTGGQDGAGRSSGGGAGGSSGGGAGGSSGGGKGKRKRQPEREPERHVGTAHLASVFHDTVSSSFLGWGYPSVFRAAPSQFRMLYQGWHIKAGKMDTKLMLMAVSEDAVHWRPASGLGCEGVDPSVTNCVYNMGSVELSNIYDDANGPGVPADERLKALLSNNTISASSDGGLSWRPLGKWSSSGVDPGYSAYRNPLDRSEIVVTGRPQALRRTSGRHAGFHVATSWSGLAAESNHRALPLDDLFLVDDQIYGLPSFPVGAMTVLFPNVPGAPSAQQVYPNTLIDVPDEGVMLVHASASTHQHGFVPTQAGTWSSLLTYRLRRDGFAYVRAAPAAAAGSGSDEEKAGESGGAPAGGAAPFATFATKQMRWVGGELRINADCAAGPNPARSPAVAADVDNDSKASPGAAVTVAVLGSDGEEIAGYEMAAASPMTTNSTNATATWRGGAEMAALAGRTVALQVHLAGSAKLYSLRGDFVML